MTRREDRSGLRLQRGGDLRAVTLRLDHGLAEWASTRARSLGWSLNKYLAQLVYADMFKGGKP